MAMASGWSTVATLTSRTETLDRFGADAGEGLDDVGGEVGDDTLELGDVLAEGGAEAPAPPHAVPTRPIARITARRLTASSA
jgi:hypothetical protein